MDEEAVKAWPLKKQLEGLEIIILQRTLDELVIVGCLNMCRKDMTPIPKEETLDDLIFTLGSERAFINIVGRKNAAKVYGKMEGVTSAMSTVDYVLKTDYATYYRELIESEKAKVAKVEPN